MAANINGFQAVIQQDFIAEFKLQALYDLPAQLPAEIAAAEETIVWKPDMQGEVQVG